MTVALWIAVFLLVLLLASVVAVLASPVQFRFLWMSAPASRLTIGVRLLGGLTPDIPVHDSTRRRPKKDKAVRKKKGRDKKPADEKERSTGRISRALSSAPRLLADLLERIHIERLAVDADIGLADPADTGQLFGLMAALQYGRPPSDVLSIALRPDFSGPTASGRVEARLSVVPFALLPPGLRFARHVFGGPR